MDHLENLTITGNLHDVRFQVSGDRTVHFDRAVIERVDFSRIQFFHVATGGSRLVDCDFSRVRFRRSVGFDTAEPTTFLRCNFDAADLRNMFNLSTTRFEQCTFRQTKIRGWLASCAEFVNCTFAGPIHSCNFSGRPVGCYEILDMATRIAQRTDPNFDTSHDAPRRTRNEFVGNDFSAAEVVGCRFTYGIDIEAQRWPTGAEYLRIDHWPERIVMARSLAEAWPTDQERDEVLALLNIYSTSGYEEQTEVFLSKDAFTYRGRSLRDVVLPLLGVEH